MDPNLLYLKNSKHPLYDEMKALFLLHSNKIEGSTFSLKQLELLITKNEISGTHDFDDVIETRNSLDVLIMSLILLVNHYLYFYFVNIMLY